MELKNPEILWLILVLLPMVGVYVLRQIKGGVAIKISTIEPLKTNARKSPMYYLRHLPFVLVCCAVVLTIIAIARPQSSLVNQKSKTQGIDIVMALDISTSMLARDFTPDRFSAAKQITNRFILDRQSDQIGIVAFAGEAYTQAPLTTDKRTLTNLVEELRMGVITDGTAIGTGLITAVNRLRNSQSPSKIVILLTDGENNAGQIDPVTAAEIAKEFGIKVYTIGVGTIGTAPYPAYDHWGDIVYQNVEVKIDEELLQNISQTTGGRYFRATDNEKLAEIYQEIDRLEKIEVEVTENLVFEEHFMTFALWALGALLLKMLLNYWIIRKIP